MSFVSLNDYYTRIRKVDLDEILIAGDSSRVKVEPMVQERISSYIRRRYDVTKIFANIPTFALSTQYELNQLLRYTEPEYVATTAYDTGNLVSYAYNDGDEYVDNIYVSLTDTNLGNTPSTSPSDWSKLTENYSYYICRKQSVNNAITDAFSYSVNAYTSEHEKILGWDRSYTIYFKREDSDIKIYASEADRTAGINYVGVIAYEPTTLELPSNRAITGGTNEEIIFGGSILQTSYIPDATEWNVVPSNYFEKQDTRNQQLVQIYLDIALKELHNLISPRNIPDYIAENYETAISDLEDMQKALTMPDLPIYEQTPNRGRRITIGKSPNRNQL